MTYNILFLRHCGPCLFSRPNTATQHGHRFIAATAICRGRFVCFNQGLRHLSPAGLPLSAASPNQSPAPSLASVQSSLERQPAASAHPRSPQPMPPTAPSDQPGARAGAGAVVGRRAFTPWLRTRPILGDNALYSTIQTAMPQPSWRRFTSAWRRCQYWRKRS